jgi:two-component system response regulator AtoC
MKILLVEDEKISRITLTDILTGEGYTVIPCETGDKAFSLMEKEKFKVIVTDLRLPGKSGMDILKKAKELNTNTSVIIMTAFATVETAVEALKSGAYDYITKPFSPDELLNMLSHISRLNKVVKENKELKKRIKSYEEKKVIGNSLPMKNLLKTIEVVAKQDYSILIHGESGTGKEMIAKELHNKGDRKDKPFIAVNCAAVPKALFESLFFGHIKGAFTGATKNHIGYFERANGGTIFIDEVDDFPLELQVKLLRVIQEREIERVGDNKAIPVDIRIICATKVDLKQMVSEGKFRDDLYYRLNVIPLYIPPLRDRKEDIPLLVEHFLTKYNADKSVRERIPKFIGEMLKYNWPGNVRELENMVQRIIALPNLTDLGLTVKSYEKTVEVDNCGNYELEDIDGLKEYLIKKEVEIIKTALNKCSNNISNAAKLLKVPRSTLRSKIEKLGLDK